MDEVPSYDRTIYLISCVKKKQARSTLARDLYVSSWFVGARQFVESTGSRWFILSAKYGLASPSAILAPYELTLNRMNKAERFAWGIKVYHQLEEFLQDAEKIVILAGQNYHELVVPYLRERGKTVEVP